MISSVLRGAAAGAAGTTALNAVTYLDMAARGRPASSTPQHTVTIMADRAGVRIPGDQETHDNRVDALGPLTGLVAGLGTGALLGAARAAGWRPGTWTSSVAASVGALVGSNGPMTLLGVTDPRGWAAADWASDVVPHLAYGLVTAWVLEGLDPN